MDFCSNTYTVQGQGTYVLYLEQRIHKKNFEFTLLYKPQKPRKFSLVKLFLFMVYIRVLVHNLYDYIRS